MSYAYENVRLNELAAIADTNKEFYDDFVTFINTKGYSSVFNFVFEKDDTKAKSVILEYIKRKLPKGIELYDGIARPYKDNKAKWLFLGWLLRDAPEQRLKPMVSSFDLPTAAERQASLLNIVRKGLWESFPNEEHWSWVTAREIIIDRLEGSRRAIKGTLFEAIVRRILAETFQKFDLDIEIEGTEIKLGGETYDVAVSGDKGTVLMPVKTRETMGGGHALLFTRDIHKSISVAFEAGYECVPIVIAESWAGDLDALQSQKSILIDKNPNQIKIVEPILRAMIEDIVPFLKEQCL